MCNRYHPTRPDRIASVLGIRVPDVQYKLGLGPWGQGPFIRSAGDDLEYVIGQWGLIAPFAKQAVNRAFLTNNARVETVAEKPTFKQAWAKGQRCLIPADTYDEPCWETGVNVWWSFRRRDGMPCMLAGLCSEWIDHSTGEVHPSYTMLTMNCDGHPLLGRMHKPDPKLPPDAQDKRTVVPLERDHWQMWLTGTTVQAQGLIQVPALGLFDAGPD